MAENDDVDISMFERWSSERLKAHLRCFDGKVCAPCFTNAQCIGCYKGICN